MLALESYAECTGPFAPNTTMQRAVEAALVAHHKAMYARVAANDPLFVDDVWGSARYSEVILGVEWLIDRGHNDTELWDLMALVRKQSEGSLGWEQWFISGDPTVWITIRARRNDRFIISMLVLLCRQTNQPTKCGAGQTSRR